MPARGWVARAISASGIGGATGNGVDRADGVSAVQTADHRARAASVLLAEPRELVWSQERADSEDHQLSLLLLLKSYQRMARFPKWDEIPGMVVDFVRKAVELPEGSVPGQYASVRTAEAHTSADCHHAHNQARDAARAVEFKRSSSPRFR
jgi:hypothetical protein